MGPLAPYEYELVYVLLAEPLAAAELACTYPISERGDSAQVIASNLRPLIKRGWVERKPSDPASGIYLATERARKAVSW